MNKTAIQYLDYTWNPLAMRCTPISEGCTHCWHIQRAKMLAENPTIFGYAQQAYAGKTEPRLIRSRLNDPLKVQKPSRIGVQFMGDLFHSDVYINSIYDIWQVMEQCQQHTFLVLTKRPERMKRMVCGGVTGWEAEHRKHIWLGCTAENQKRADERIPTLLKIPAAVRFVSLEPLLGAVTFRWAKWQPISETKNTDHLDGLRCLDWVIIGAETGPGARPMNPDWARSVRDECQEAGVPFFMKKMSNNEPIPDDLMIREYPKH